MERQLSGLRGECPHCRGAWYEVVLVGQPERPPPEPCPVCGRPPRVIRVELVPVRRCHACGTVYEGNEPACPSCGRANPEAACQDPG